MRVDHVEKYRLPKNLQEKEDDQEGGGAGEKDFGPGHAYKDRELKNKYSLDKGRDLFAPPSDDESSGSSSASRDDNGKADKTKSSGKDKEAKQKRKEERARKRKEKEERRKQKEEKRQKKEDKKRKKRARHMRDDDDYGDNKRRERVDSKRSRKDERS